MKSSIVAVAAALALAVSGCAGADNTDPAAPAAQGSATAPAANADPQAFLAAYGLDGLSPEEIVDRLEATNEDRQSGPKGSVRPDELVLSDDNNEVSLPLEDRFYLSFAPYENRTHDCFNHHLTSCQGELPNQAFDVTIIDSDGATLVEETATSHDNGFVGLWLPKDITGTITVRAEGKEASGPLSTGADDPTCVTTLQLT